MFENLEQSLLSLLSKSLAFVDGRLVAYAVPEIQNVNELDVDILKKQIYLHRYIILIFLKDAIFSRCNAVHNSNALNLFL